MARTYTLRRRAEGQAETRRRIVEAAVDLHTTVGPALTTISMIADKAGVQRHTFYAHFPDERGLLLACSGMALERDPLPEAEPWRAIADWRQRLRAGLSSLYDYYKRNDELTSKVMRDEQHHPLVKEIVELRFGPSFATYRQVLGEGLSEAQRLILRLALSFYTWSTLTRESGLDSGAAAETMVAAIESAGGG